MFCGTSWRNVDPSHLHISQFDEGLSPPWSVILKYGNVEQCGCNVDVMWNIVDVMWSNVDVM